MIRLASTMTATPSQRRVASPLHQMVSRQCAQGAPDMPARRCATRGLNEKLMTHAAYMKPSFGECSPQDYYESRVHPNTLQARILIAAKQGPTHCWEVRICAPKLRCLVFTLICAGHEVRFSTAMVPDLFSICLKASESANAERQLRRNCRVWGLGCQASS